MPIKEKPSLWKKVMTCYQQHKAVRLPVEPLKKEVVKLLRPELPEWDNISTSTIGQKRNIDVFNAAPQEGLETWADGMQGHLASASMPWFIFRVPGHSSSLGLNKVPRIRKWLMNTQEVQADVLAAGRYYSHLNPVFRDAGSVGGASSWIELNEKKNGIACLNFHPREVFVSLNSQGEVNQFLRGSYQLSALAAAQAFDKNKLGSGLQNCLKTGSGNPLTRFKFIHLTVDKDDPILEGEERIPNRPYISIYIQEDADARHQEPLRIEGYWSKPYSYWQFQRSPGNPYGWGLGCSAICDIYGLHQLTKSNLIHAEFVTDPALFAKTTMRGRIHLTPGGQTFGKDTSDKPEMLFAGGKYPFSADREDRAVQAIERWFNVHFFEQLNRADREMTAYEIAQRINEKGIILGPKVGRLNEDLFDQQHKRVYDICYHQGWIEDPPQQLLDQAGSIHVEYNGLLEQAMRIAREIQQTQGVFEQVTFLTGIKDDIPDNFDIDKTAVRIARNRSLPEDEIRSPEEVKQIRGLRLQLLQEQQQKEEAAIIADKVPALSKAPERGSPIQQLTGAGA